MEIEQTVSPATPEADIHYWRREFARLRDKHPDDWRDLARSANKRFETGEGERILNSVADGRGSIVRTNLVVCALRDATNDKPLPRGRKALVKVA